MPPKSIIETNASSIIDLKALLSQQKEQFDRERSGAQLKTPSKTESNKKSSRTIQQNRGVEERARRDKATYAGNEEEVDILEKSRIALERKAKIYDTLQRQHQQLNNLDDVENSDLLIDFDQKYFQQRDYDTSRKKKVIDKEEERHSSDPWVEYEDEFGRTRVVRQSQLPRPRSRSPSPDPTTSRSFDIIEPADRSHIRHYVASQENRTRGVGHYSFAVDDEERQIQIANLNKLRQETEAARRKSRTASERRRAIIAKRAEHIHHRRAILRGKNKSTSQTSTTINEDNVTQLLQTMRKLVEK
ncbi:uncharacterized protein BX664DRAFT_323715 [Halteromyces radiatus]|uniref:uncharacterized protein n=1 Tax=Halteromyces radiatus TaxID=101107 RepID=UPI00221ED168|nr:uncharacterized protein BX664DRAFT_323715 [Halteromyces radiatus]KAI8096344.1 hypothetical protein BX664DRAFT_323715 [Halteromyces radiatus]